MQRSLYITTCRRCGTHWLKHIVSDALGFNRTMPDMDRFKKSPWHRNYEYPKEVERREHKEPGAYVYVSHTPLGLLRNISEVMNVAVLVRDLRDVCVSNAYYVKKDKQATDEEIRKKALEYLDKGGPTPNFNQSYLENRGIVPHCLVRFEDLVVNTFDAVSRMFMCFGYEYDKDALVGALEKNSFRNLSGGRERGHEDRMHHYRKGIVNESRNFFSNQDEQIFWANNLEIMRLWGYAR